MENRYIVVINSSVAALTAAVNEFVGIGYKPVGGVLYISVGGSQDYLQAMFKE